MLTVSTQELDFSFGNTTNYILRAQINSNSTINLHSFQPRIGITNHYAIPRTEAVTTVTETIERMRAAIKLYESFLAVIQ